VVFLLFKFQAYSSALSGDAENPLIGKMLLLIAKKTRRVDELYDNVVEVIRLIDEVDILLRNIMRLETIILQLKFVVLILQLFIFLFIDCRP
jgi:hypothetical protein